MFSKVLTLQICYLTIAITSQSWLLFAEKIQSFDYIVVGGGTAGFVVAEYLSRDPSIQLLILEAGPDGTNVFQINTPALATEIPGQFFWNYTSQSEPDRGIKSFPRPQGHALGGSSAVNYMQYCRSAASTFDDWASQTGLDALRWENILNDFEATSHETPAPPTHPALSKIVPTADGNGSVEVSQRRELNGFDQPFQDVLKQTFNLQEVDFNTGVGVGVTYGDATIRDSNRTRDYSLEAFGWKLVSRPNVRIEHDAWVTHVGFEGRSARNVSYIQAEQETTVSAQEIILSAGALGSPKILMLSGVGPQEHLADLGIPIVEDIPEVGSHLYDHHGSSVVVEVPNSVATAWQLQYNASFSALAAAQYQQNADGFLSSPPGGSFAVTRIPDSVFSGANVPGSDHFTSAKPDAGQLMYQFAPAAIIPGLPNVTAVTVIVSLTLSLSFGHVRLNSSDYRDYPLVYSNYFGTAADQAAITYAYKTLRTMLQSETMSGVVVRELFPGPSVSNDDDDALWESIKDAPAAYFHPMGTTGLGRVLDNQFRVKGMQGIRVVDAGAFPYSTTCHPQANVYAFALAAAKVIKEADSSC